ncbi:MAG: hypothetical protein F4139_10545 [Gemmatimonadetes bacterium]|nr:hypothetical protein [Gemmatimonadota bacterium]MYA63267.1 hypothetical protein [Gemmatimonadota bacterium]MYB97005.1 hypothetical protein [Gemmatimonadota bacterium]MYH53374.1 hypothetical protein [Gemmatimonadota bacterium]MYI46022.1 hypothetical protein [Gemmatimonadota bacterium]
MSRSRPARESRTPEPELAPADVQAVRAALNRAARRLNILELIILSAAAIASIAGGWLAALLATRAFGFPFRMTWVGASLALFVIPALAAYLVNRRRQGAQGKSAADTTDQSPAGDTE